MAGAACTSGATHQRHIQLLAMDKLDSPELMYWEFNLPPIEISSAESDPLQEKLAQQ